jgi:hypothetical protein
MMWFFACVAPKHRDKQVGGGHALDRVENKTNEKTKPKKGRQETRVKEDRISTKGIAQVDRIKRTGITFCGFSGHRPAITSHQTSKHKTHTHTSHIERCKHSKSICFTLHSFPLFSFLSFSFFILLLLLLLPFSSSSFSSTHSFLPSTSDDLHQDPTESQLIFSPLH